MDDASLIQALGQYNASTATDRGFKAANDYNTGLADLYNKQAVNQYLPQQQQADLAFKAAQTGYQNALARGQNVTSDLHSDPKYINSTLGKMQGEADSSMAKGEVDKAGISMSKFVQFLDAHDKATTQLYQGMLQEIGMGNDPYAVVQKYAQDMPQTPESQSQIQQFLAIGKQFAGHPQEAMQYLQKQLEQVANAKWRSDPKLLQDMQKNTNDNLARLRAAQIQAATAAKKGGTTALSSLGKTALQIANAAGREQPNEEDWNKAAKLTASASAAGQPSSQTAGWEQDPSGQWHKVTTKAPMGTIPSNPSGTIIKYDNQGNRIQ